MISFRAANSEYIEQTRLYNKKDIISSILLYSIMIILFILMGKHFIQKGETLSQLYIFGFTGIISLLCIVLVFFLCAIRKHKLITVGFSYTYAKKSFTAGIMIIILFSVLKGIIPVIFYNSTIRTDFGQILMKFCYYLFFIAFMEEIVFRGYIGTRFYGYFKNKLLSIIVVGILCALLHIPFQMVVTQLSLSKYISINMGIIYNYFFWHLIEQWLYAKYNSIIAPVMLHFIMDFIGWIII